MSVAASTGTTACPFPGLRPFREADSHLFFGREGQARELLRRLQRRRFLAVLGTSGSGKSSLVNAGLLPALHGDYLIGARARWQIVTFRPGADPLGRLTEKLGGLDGLTVDGRAELRQSSMAVVRILQRSIDDGRWDPDTNLLIIVDQFEEMFRYSPQSQAASWDERAMFVRLLIEGCRPLHLPFYVVTTMRSEYLGDCAQFRELPETINEGQYLIPGLTRENWRAAIEGPARLAGAQVAPELVNRLLNDVARLETRTGNRTADDDADALPLLQHALSRTWIHLQAARANDAKVASRLEISHFEAVGGLEEALSRHLDEALAEARADLGERGVVIAQRIFQRLRVRDLKGRQARDPLAFAELCAVVGAPHEDVQAVLDCFRSRDRNFLIPEYPHAITDASEIDLTHECLVRRWNKLKTDWIRDEDESRRLYLRLAQAADENDLVSGARLQLAGEWWNRRRPTEAWAKRYDPRFELVRAFLERSIETEACQAREEEAAGEAERRRREREAFQGKAIRFFAASLLVIAIIGAKVYWDAKNAKRLAEAADHNRGVAFAQLLATKAQLALSEVATPRQTVALLAAAAVRYSQQLHEPSPLESRIALANAVPWMPKRITSLATKGPVVSLARAHREDLLAAATRDGSILFSDLSGVVKKRSLEIHRRLRGITLSRDGKYLVATGQDAANGIGIWEVASGKQVAQLPCERPTGLAVLAPDNSMLLAACSVLLRWDEHAWRAGQSGSPVKWAKELDPVRVIVFEDPGNQIAVAGEDATNTDDRVLLSDRQTSRVSRRVPLGDVDVEGVVFFSEGMRIAVADDSYVVRVMRIDRPDEQPVVFPHGRPVIEMSPSSDGFSLLTVTDDGIARLWESTGRREGQISLGQEVTHASFDWSKRTLAAGGVDLSLWSAWDPSWRHVLPQPYFELLRKEPLLQRTLPLVMTDVRGIGADVVFVRNPYGFRSYLLDKDGKTRPLNFETVRPVIWTVSDDGTMIAGVNSKVFQLHRQTTETFYKLQWQHPLNNLVGSRLYFSSDQRVVARVVDEDGHLTFELWDTTTGDPKGPPANLTSVGVSVVQVVAEGHVLVARQNGSIVDWTPATNAARSVTTAPSLESIRSPAVAAINHRRTVLAVGDAGSIRLLRWPELTEIRSWTYEGSASLLAFTADDAQLAVAGSDGGMRIWSSGTGEELSRIQSPEPLTNLAFSTDGRRLIAASYTSVMRYLWDTEDLIGEACERADANLTAQEWARYVPQSRNASDNALRCVCSMKIPCP